MANVHYLDVCLSKRIREDSWQELNKYFSKETSDGYVHYSFEFNKFRDELENYLEQDKVFFDLLKREFGQEDIKSLINLIDEEDQELSENSDLDGNQISRLEKLVYDYLYDDQGTNLLLEYQRFDDVEKRQERFDKFKSSFLRRVLEKKDLFEKLFETITKESSPTGEERVSGPVTKESSLTSEEKVSETIKKEKITSFVQNLKEDINNPDYKKVHNFLYLTKGIDKQVLENYRKVGNHNFNDFLRDKYQDQNLVGRIFHKSQNAPDSEPNSADSKLVVVPPEAPGFDLGFSAVEEGDIQEYDHSPAIEESRSELFNGRSFRGCKFENIEFICPIEDVDFRDGRFEEVAFNGTIDGMRLEGSNSTGMAFFSNKAKNISIGTLGTNTLENLDPKVKEKAKEIKDKEIKEKIAKEIEDKEIEDKKIKEIEEKITKEIEDKEIEDKKIKEIEDKIAKEIEDKKIKEKIDNQFLEKGIAFFYKGNSVTYSLNQYKTDLNELIQSAKFTRKQEATSEWGLSWIGGALNSFWSTGQKSDTAKNGLEKFKLNDATDFETKKLTSELLVYLNDLTQNKENDDLKKRFKEITELYALAKSEYQTTLNLAINSAMTVENLVRDLTYVKGQDDNISKFRIKCTVQEVEEFTNSKEKNFVKFVTSQHQQEVSAKEVSEKELDDFFRIVVVPDLSGLNLTGLNFSGKDVSGTIFSGCNLDNCDFSKTKIFGSCFENASVDKAIFDRAKMQDVNIINIVGSSASFKNIIAEGLKANGAKLGATNQESADLSGSKISGSDVSRSDFSDCNLNETKLEIYGEGCNLSYANASSSTIKNTELVRSDMVGMDVSGSNVSNTKIKKSYAPGLKAREASLENTEITDSDISHSDLSNSKLNGLVVDKSNMNSVNMDGSKGIDDSGGTVEIKRSLVHNLSVNEADHKKFSIEDSTGVKVSIQGSDIGELSLSGSFVPRADISKSNIDALDTRGAYAIAMNANGTTLGETLFDDDTNLAYSYITDAQVNEAFLEKVKQDTERTEDLNKGLVSKLLGDKARLPLPRTQEEAKNRYRCQTFALEMLSGIILNGDHPVDRLKAKMSRSLIASFADNNNITASAVQSFSKWLLSHVDPTSPEIGKELGFINNRYGDVLAVTGAMLHSLVVKAVGHATNKLEADLINDLLLPKYVAYMFSTNALSSYVRAVSLIEVPSTIYKNVKLWFSGKEVTDTLLSEIKKGATNGISSYLTLALNDVTKNFSSIISGDKLPEQIYEENNKSHTNFKEQYLPSKAKLAFGVASGALLVGVTALICITFLPATLFGLAVGTVLGASALITGVYYGYKYAPKMTKKVKNLFTNITAKSKPKLKTVKKAIGAPVIVEEVENTRTTEPVQESTKVDADFVDLGAENVSSKVEQSLVKTSNDEDFVDLGEKDVSSKVEQNSKSRGDESGYDSDGSQVSTPSEEKRPISIPPKIAEALNSVGSGMRIDPKKRSHKSMISEKHEDRDRNR